ncbi:beta-propeller domain-containing protein [Candidatus Nitrosopumilus sediminis]|uniref:Copper amine oxidase-like protein n=1 Tax=Candidatus Nitrosopumilus sediminis TaxID=1229909 RepID=K0BBB8_9ARCH|nr:beta-propeller domain-containing protein [Candidatus Nitrosopumilus sediminis]AFS82285.1 copper amine oxidase-like protein [Candidatus Nitrosopumilus sediminis]
MNPKTIIPITVIISVIVTAGIMYTVGFEQQPQIVQTSEPEIIYVDKSVSGYLKGTNEIKKISSQQELQNILEASSSFDGGFDPRILRNFADDAVMMESSETTGMPVPSVEPMPADGASNKVSGGTDYSTTNVQVANVDEPDYLKNDSKYVYIVSQNKLSIIDAYPAESAKLVLKIALDIESQHIENMFLNEDRLVIFYNGQSDEEIIPQFDFIPRRSYSSVTHALIVDVSDKEKPTILKDYSIDGHFRDARMIGDYAYFVTNSNVDYQYPRLPIIMEDSVRIMTPEAFYFDNVEQFSNFNTLTAINIFDDTINSETFLMGYTGAFYVSKDNFYLTYQQNMPYGFYENSSRDRFFDVVVPLLPKEIQDEIKNIKNSEWENSSAQWNAISELMQKSYNEMDKKDKEVLFEKIRNALNEYDRKIQEETRKTIIHKISIDEDKIEYVAKGTVPGRLLNQFSMDENGDRFRVATTSEIYTQYEGTVRSNAVYVLNENLEIVGELEEIAPDESIFSARFMGDRLYLVTFQQIDPFFVIDLSSDTPKILGELKIPGFSNYLHPYDEEHVIGVGRDTKEIDNGRVQQLGIKIALFNVADVDNPKVADDIIIGDSSTQSEALYNHKAFFFDKSRGVLSIPVSGDIKSLKESSDKMFAPEYNRWSGFYVFDLDKSNGFELKGTVTHSDDSSRYYGMNYARTFYIDDVLYTASNDYLKMNSFDELKEINSIKFENTGKFIEYLDEEIIR